MVIRFTRTANIVINLLDSDSLSGSYTPDYGDTLLVEEVSDCEVSTDTWCPA